MWLRHAGILHSCRFNLFALLGRCVGLVSCDRRLLVLVCTDLLREAGLLVDIDGVLFKASRRLFYVDIGVIGAQDMVAEQIVKLLSLLQVVKCCEHCLRALLLEQLLTLAQVGCALCD